MSPSIPARTLPRWLPWTITALAAGAIGALSTSWLIARDTRLAHENAAAATLRYLAMRMNEFKLEAVIDQDGDGRGEYPFLAEITGLRAPRGARAEGAQPHNHLARTLLGESSLRHGGTALKDGYCFRIFLPQADGVYRPDPGEIPAGDARHADAEESGFVILAWPQSLDDGDWIYRIAADEQLETEANEARRHGLKAPPPTPILDRKPPEALARRG